MRMMTASKLTTSEPEDSPLPGQVSATIIKEGSGNGSLQRSLFLEKCRICNLDGRKKCGNCNTAYYCSTNHQSQDWPQHQLDCGLWTTVEGENGASTASNNANNDNNIQSHRKRAIANKNISPGKTIMIEYPLLTYVNPDMEENAINNVGSSTTVRDDHLIRSYCCLGCEQGFVNLNLKKPHRCGKCLIPICSASCENSYLHQKDCEMLEELSVVVSPVTGRVLGAKEVRVVNDRVFITSMKVQVSSGVQLSLFPDTDAENEFIAETTITSKLSAKYQEALLDIKLRFSDNAWIKLDEIDREHYVLAVDSLDPTVVELPQIQNSKYPRILAVSEGGGPIMRVSLELSDQCHRQNSPPLAISVAQVEVNFTTTTSRSEFTQNDSNQGLGTSKHSFRKPSRGSKDRLFNGVTNGGTGKKDISAGLKSGAGGSANTNDITGMPLRDDSSKASLPTHNYGLNVGFGPDKGWTMAAQNTPLQIAIYVLLGVFSVAILVFVASCVVYASRVKKREFSPVDAIGMGMKMEHATRVGATTNAHDWVWLGRASLALHPSLDSSKNTNKSVSFESSGSHLNPIRIITNPNFDGQANNGSVNGGSTTVLGAATSQQSLNSNSVNVPSLNATISPQPVLLQNNTRPLAWVEPPRLAPPPPRPPKPQAQSPAATIITPSQSPPIDSATFSVKSPTQQQQQQVSQHPQLPQIQPPKPIKLNSPAGVTNGSSQNDCPDYRPPVPPHRNLPSPSPSSTPPRSSTKHGGGSTGSTGSHHSSTNSSKSKNTKDPDELPNPSFVEYEPQQAPIRRGENDIKRTNIVGNPMCYIDEEDEDDEEEMRQPLTVAAAVAAAARHKNHHPKQKIPNIGSNVKLDMDYDQLMEYFDSLKETEA